MPAPLAAPCADVAGLLLAGGQARRLGGGDKGLRLLAGRPLLAHAVAALAPQVARLALSANGDPARFAGFGLPVLPDGAAAGAGPLAGVLAGLRWAAGLPGVRWLATVPADTPFLPADLVARLRAGGGGGLACAASSGRRHPVVALWPLALAGELERAVLGDGVRRVGAWTAAQGMRAVAWPADPVDPFFNVNAPADLAEAERLFARRARLHRDGEASQWGEPHV